jgi:glycosyltransferase involved in cell wall biosynthesis
VVPPSDPRALTRALTALLRDEPLRSTLGAQGRAHVLATHDLRQTTGAVTDVYRELLGLLTTQVAGPDEGRKCITT